MGYARAAEMIEFAGFDYALNDHLQHNCFPPITLQVVPYAKQAIQHCKEENPDEEITFPNGVVRTAGQIVEDLHLWAFVESEDV
jgi:hypothetical protein